jgi:peptidoglycan/xylan/chitin deacetylase (PgdA/CDA1 family)
LRHEPPKIALTIDVEDLYCVDFKRCMSDILSFLDKRRIPTTMFFLGTIASDHPKVLEEAYARGHEIGCHGLDHLPAAASDPKEFQAKVKESKGILEKSIHHSVSGFRSPDFSLPEWLLSQLKGSGFEYDSSVYPCLPIMSWYGLRKAPIYPYHPNLQNPEETNEAEEFLEFPIAVMPETRLPAGGGWWLRNLGTTYSLISRSRLLKKGPAVLYFHPWEFTENLSLNIEKEYFGDAVRPPLMFRRTGTYLFKLIDRIRDKFSPDFVTIKQVMNSLTEQPLLSSALEAAS